MPHHAATRLRSRFQHSGLKPAVLALAVATAFGAMPAGSGAQTLPSGGVAVHGQAVITQPAANQLRVVTQNGAGTSHSAINWQSFSISAGATATIVQPTASSLSINRVVTNTPSAIFGNLSSNGRLVLVNQSGIAVGAGAIIDTAGFTASALRMSDADALAGRLRFGEPGASMGGAAGLTVGGRITARDGDIVLVAPNIDLGTSALLQAPNGSTILAAGQQVEITGRGLEGITMLVQAPADQARNLGRLEGNAVGIFAGTLRHSGDIRATTASLEGGTVVLRAAGDAYVEGAGSVDASGTRGGKVDVLGSRVAVMDQAVIDVSGDTGGGQIRIGGDYQGRNAAVPNALRTYLGAGTQLRADALAGGDGGRVILWADEVTRAYGSISARGGLTGGNGGFAEVSGLKNLVFEARVDLRAPRGLVGTLLLDPDFIDIFASGSDPLAAGDEFSDPSGFVSISPAALQAVGGNVMLQSNGDITFSDAVNLTTPGASLTALAGNLIRVDATITTNAGAVVLHSAAPGAAGTGSSDSDAIYINAAITSNGGTISLSANSCDLFCDGIVIGAPVNAGAGNIVMDSLGDIRQSGSGTLAAANLNVNADAVIDLNLGGNAIPGNVSLITNVLTAGTSLVQFHNSAASFVLNNATAKGAVNIAAAGVLTSDGSITSTAGNVLINALGGMSLGDDVAAAGTLTLLSNNATITQTGGAVTAIGASTINAGSGDVLLLGAGNDFTSVALTGGNIALADANGMTVTALTSVGADRNLSLRANGGALALPAAAINAGNGSIDLRSAGVLTTPGQLTGGTVQLAGVGGIVISDNINVSGGQLELKASGGSISQSGGQIVVAGGATTVFDAAGVTVNLSAAGNDFGEISGATGALTLVDANDVLVGATGGGIHSSNGNITLSATGIGNTTLLGSLNAGSGNVTLNSRSVTQSGGAITASTLTVNSSLGSVTLNGANDVAAARLSGSGASAIAFNNVRANYALSGTGGTLTVTGGGHATVDQTTNFANGIDITSTSGITLAANITPGGDLSLTASTGLIDQSAGTLFANSGTATILAGAGDIALTSATNEFNVVNLVGGHITVLASGGLIVNTLSSGTGRNVFLDAGAGTLLLPATPINAGTGQITLTSGGDLFLGGALTGSDILLSASTGLTIDDNITASGFLSMGSTSGGVTQSIGTAIVVTGITFVGAGTAAVTLNEAGNNFSTIEADGGVITLRDSNALNLGLIDATTSLSVQANGNVTQTASVIVSGTTAISAGTGNVTLTTAGNNLNELSVSGQAINVVEGAGSNLTVTSLTSGLNQPVSLSAGHTLTLPGTAINTGTADLTLSSAIGQLTIPAALNGNNISLSAVTGATVNAPITAAGDFTATLTGGGSTLTVNRQVSAGNDMTLNLAGNLSVLAGSGVPAGMTAVGDQTITAGGNILLQGAATGGGGRAELVTTGAAGTQSITANGITLLGGDGSLNYASIQAAGFQNVTVGNGGITLTGGGGALASNYVEIEHLGPVGTSQLITVNGTGSLHLVAGSAAGGDSEAAIRSEFGGSQTITFSGTGAGRAINLTGGTVGTDSYAEIWAGVATQVINGAGLITLTGGASGGGASFGGGDLLGNVAAIGADAGNQTIVASGLVLHGGGGGLNNLAGVFAGGNQLITLGAGGLSLTGGGGGPSDLKNMAIVWKGSDVPGTTQTISVSGGGTIALVGGSASGTNVGTDADFGGLSNGAFAAIRSEGTAQLIEFLAPGGSIELTGGTVGSDNHAMVFALNGTQTIRGSSAANAPTLVLTGGESGGVGGAANEGNRAMIFSLAGNQNVTASAISLAGGSAGNENVAQIRQGDASNGLSSTQVVTVVGGGDITLQGGDGTTNFARIRAFGTSQTVSFSAGGAINATGGSAGVDNLAQVIAHNGDQFVTGVTAINLQGGSGGSNSRAQITAPLGSQTLNVGSGGLTLIGGSGGAGELSNFASVFQGGTTGEGQTITVGGGGNITLAAGDSAGTSVGLDNGSLAYITSQGDSQLIEFSGAGSTISIVGGTVGSRNEAGILALFGSQTIGGTTVGNAPAIVLIGGADGGQVGESNAAQIAVNSASQSITARSISLTGGADGTENIARIRQGTPSSGLSSNQSITITAGGALSLHGGGGVTNLADIRGHGPVQTIHFSAGGSLSLTGGDGVSLNYARIESINGNQTISGLPTITVTGGAAGGASLQGNFASIQAAAGGALQTIDSGAMTLNAGAAGTNNFAFIGAAVQDIAVTGNLALNGGGSAGSLDGTLGGGARIGAPGTGATDLTLDVTGNLTITGGSAAGAAIGAGVAGGAATNLDITVGGNVSLLPGAVSTAGARIGSPSLAPGGGNILIDAGGSITLGTTGGGDTGVITTGNVHLEGNTVSIADGVLGNRVELYGVAGVSLSGFAAIAASDTGDALKIRLDSGAFSNTASTNPLSAPNGRWLVYSVDPANDTRGNLVHDFKQYDAVPGDAVLGSGNGLLYSLPAPSVTATLVGVVSKTYDGTAVANLSEVNYSATGIDGDVIVLNNPSTGTYDTKDIGTGKLVVAGGLSLVSAVDASAKPVFGYNPTVSPASGLVGDIGAASITAVTGITAVDKVYDATPAATLVTSGAVLAGKATGDNLVLSAATGTFDTKDVGTGKTVNITGLSLSGTDAGNYILSAGSATTTGNITPATISGITGITAANKVYDGDIGAILTTSGAVFTGRLGSDVLSVATAVGNFSDKHVANPKTVNITGLSLGGTDAGNYTLANTTATTAAAITPATITAVAGLSATKVYDGTTSATAVTSGATFTGAFSGDNLTVTASSANFSDRNVGTGKALTATGLTLGGADAGNYSFAVASATGTGTITQRPLSTWSGAGGDGLWSNPLNWDAIPDGSNVATVSIPAGAGSVSFDGAMPATSLQTVSSLRPLSMAGGSLAISATLAAEDFSQSGGALGGTGSLVVTNSFNQTGGSIAMGNLTIVQNTGNLVFSNLSGNTVALVAPAGTVSQSGPLVASTLTLSSLTGIGLTNPGNQIGNLFAENLGTGLIAVDSNGPMNVVGLSNAGGDILVSANGALSTFGPVTSANGSVALAATGGIGSMGIFAPVIAADQVFLSALTDLTQDAAVVGTNGVTADAGTSIVLGLQASANYDPVVYRVAGIVVASPPLQPLLGGGLAALTEERVDPVVTFLDLLEAAVNEAVDPEVDDFDPDGTRKKSTGDTIVTEGEVCN